MDIEMIQFSALLSIMLIFFWLLITVFFILISKFENKKGKRQKKYSGKARKRRKKGLKRKISKGEIYYANLNGTIGSEQSGTRPVIIIQNDIGNKHSPTVIIVPLTGRIENGIVQPTHYYLKPFGKLKYESVVLTEQIRAIDKRRLRSYWGKLSSKQIEKLDKCLSIALGIN